MKLALCTTFLSGDLWEARLRDAVPTGTVHIDECGDPVVLSDLLKRGIYDAAVIVMPGARGMETVRFLRTMCQDVPILWISDDQDFALSGYEQQVLFLPNTASDEAVRTVMAYLRVPEREADDECCCTVR